MKDELLSEDIAKIAKEKGFNIGMVKRIHGVRSVN